MKPVRQRGFTLLEVLVAVAILAIIMVLVQATTKQILDSKERIEARDMVYQEARVALRKLSDDLAVAFLVRHSLTPLPEGAPPPAGGETPPLTAPTTAPTIATFFIGEDHGERDLLRFTTLSHLRHYKDAHESEQARVKYEIVPSAEDNQLLTLVRTEVPWLDDKTQVEGKGVPLVEAVTGFDVEYYDVRKEEWVKEWDTEKVDWKDKLPAAVRVTLLLPDPDGGEEPRAFSTAVPLALSVAPIDF